MSSAKGNPVYDARHHDAVVVGMATILWGSAWADHVEEHRCCNLSGVEITSVMPAVPAEAYALAERSLGAIEISNPQWGCNWPSVFAAACRTDGLAEPPSYLGALAERFGECLAYMASGAGVSWFDDHAMFDLVVPLCCEGYSLQILAEQQCPRRGQGVARC